MRTAILAAAALAVLVATVPASAQQARRSAPLVIEIKPRSWLDAGTAVPVGYGQSTVRDTWVFGGGPVNGIGSRGESNLPTRGGAPLFTFDFLGANVNR